MSVYIHNFYTDVLLSLRYLFDSVIFERENYIKHYQFNYGNRAFQLSNTYNTQFRLPAAYISLQGDSLTGQRKKTHILKQIPVNDINQHLVLYNSTNKGEIYLQEEEIDLNISVNLNCESQLQAQDIKFIVERWLPSNHILELYEFVSFLEIPLPFLQTAAFNPTTDNIYNLYTRYDHNIGEVIYSFAVRYRPLIRCSDISLSISDSSQRTFSVQCNLIFTIQRPVYLICYDYRIIDAIRINFNQFAHETIAPIAPFTITTSTHSTYDILLNYLFYDLPIYIYAADSQQLISYSYLSEYGNITTYLRDNNILPKNSNLPDTPQVNESYLSLVYNFSTRKFESAAFSLKFPYTLLSSTTDSAALNLNLIQNSNTIFRFLTNTDYVSDYIITNDIDNELFHFNITLNPTNINTVIRDLLPSQLYPLVVQVINN